MVFITDWEGPVIFVPFPKEKYIKILKGFGYTLDTTLSVHDYELILLAALYEFKKGVLSLDDVGAIGGMIFYAVDKKESLAWKAHAAEECIFYVRRSGELLGSLRSFLNQLNEFYDEGKTKLDGTYKSCYVLKTRKKIKTHTSESPDPQ